MPSDKLPEYPHMPTVYIRLMNAFCFLNNQVPVSQDHLLLHQVLLIRLASLSMHNTAPAYQLQFQLSSPDVQNQYPVPIR